MKYQVLFRIEKKELIDKLFAKIQNLQDYFQDSGHILEIEVVFSGDVVTHFIDNRVRFYQSELDIVVCHNALQKQGMSDISDRNIRTVKAGIGEIVQKKAQGYIEVTIE